ncbi:hypothetical protein D3C71_1115780 [compost metagenome]
MVPSLPPSLAKVKRKPLGQWSQRPGSSQKPYSVMTGNSPSWNVTFVPAGDVTCILLAFLSSFDASSTRLRSASVGTARTRTSGGSTASRIFVPDSRISICSGENSSSIKSRTRSLFFIAASAAGLLVRGVAPR